MFYTVPVAAGEKKPLSVKDDEGKYSWKPLMAQKSIDDWRLEYEGCNIAVITGSMSGVFVIDLDRRELLEELGLPETLTVITKRGYHLYYRYPDFHVGNSCWREMGIDVRGENGVAVYIGSVVDGWNYSFVNNAPIIEPTQEVYDLLEKVKTKGGKQPERQALPKAEVKEVEVVVSQEMTKLGKTILKTVEKNVRAAEEGERNEALNLAAFYMGQVIAGGYADERTVRATLHNAYLETNPEALHHEIKATLTSGITKGKESPYKPLTPLQVANALYGYSLTVSGPTKETDRLVLQAICYFVLKNDVSTPIVSRRDIINITGKHHKTVEGSINRLLDQKVIARKANRKQRGHAQAYKLGEWFFSGLAHNLIHSYGKDIVSMLRKLPFGDSHTDVQDVWATRELGDSGRQIFDIFLQRVGQTLQPKDIIQLLPTNVASNGTIYRKLNKMVDYGILHKEGKGYVYHGEVPEAQKYRGRLDTMRLRNQQERERFASYNNKK